MWSLLYYVCASLKVFMDYYVFIHGIRYEFRIHLDSILSYLYGGCAHEVAFGF